MIQSFSFSEGAVLGGPILFKEPEEEFTRRLKIDRIYWILLPVCLILGISFPYILAKIDEFKLVPGVAETEAIFTVCLVLSIFILGFWRFTPRSSVIVYNNGISIGYGKKPYYRFSDLHYVEDYISIDADGFPHTNIGLTFSDGEFKGCLKMLRHEDVYRDFLDTLKKHFSGLKKGKPWTKDAEEIIASMSGPKGPVRYTIEELALRQQIKEITLELIHINWQRVAEEQRHSKEFRRLAKKLWGDS